MIAVGSSLEPLPVVPMNLIWSESAVAGSRGFTPRDIRDVIDLHRSGAITTDHLLNDRIPLDEINPALDALRAGETLRSVVAFGDGW